MVIKEITEHDKKAFNKVVSHPLQSYEWGEFRKKTNVKVIRRGIFKTNKLIDGFQLTIHPIPKTPWTIGYLPKGNIPTEEVLHELKVIGKAEKCIFIQLEPNVKAREGRLQINNIIHNSQFLMHNSEHPLFTKYTFILNLTKSEEELLKSMHSKARYNIKIAKKHGVEIIFNSSEETLQTFLRLNSETNTRQKFYTRPDWHFKEMKKLFNEFPVDDKNQPREGDSDDHLRMQILTATYKSKPLVSWILFSFHDTLYYPYGASSSEHREVMASSLIMWEAIRLGKNLRLKNFDMWGALEPNPDPQNPWFGFHTFKQKYGPEHVEFIGSYDFIINKSLYQVYKIANKLRWLYLRFKK